jgi:hypothetical protein
MVLQGAWKAHKTSDAHRRVSNSFSVLSVSSVVNSSVFARNRPKKPPDSVKPHC